MIEGEGSSQQDDIQTSVSDQRDAGFADGTNDKDRIVETAHERQTDPERIARIIDQYVDRRIVALEPKETEYSFDFDRLSTAEKVVLLHEDLVARYNRIIEINQNVQNQENIEAVDPYILAEIGALWSNAEVKKLYLSRYAEARVDAKMYYLSETGLRYKTIDQEITKAQTQFESIVRAIRQNESVSPDKILSLRRQRDQLMRKIVKERQERQDIFDMKEEDGTLPPLEENTDIVADIQYEKIVNWSKQAREGFVWMDALLDAKLRILDTVSNYRMPILIGESRVGKSELSRSTFEALTGHEPEVIPCDSNTSEADIIGLQGIDPKTGGDTVRFGKAAFAATGYEYSTQENPTFTTARGVLFDEIYRLNPQKGFSAVKSFRQWREGRKIHGKSVLPNSFGIGTTNPPGLRYPNHHKPEVALQEEFAEIKLDYLPNTADDPQGYEFILAELMDPNGLIPVSADELAPAYDKTETQKPSNFPMEDSQPDYKYTQEILNPDAYDVKHGFAWRLACAARSVQDAFNLGNPGGAEAGNNPLRYSQNSEGVINISSDGNDEIITLNSTINAGEIAQWCQAFRDRFGLENQSFHTETLTAFMKTKLENFVGQIPDEEDRAKMRAILEYFHLFDEAPKTSDSKPLTPKEIGYLSPRVPRPIKIQKTAKTISEETTPQPEKTTEPEEIKMHDDTEIVLEDGSKILIKEEAVEFQDSENKTVKLYPGLRFSLAEEKVAYGGLPTDPQYAGKVALNMNPTRKDEALYRLVDLAIVKELGKDFWPLENLNQQEIERQYNEWQETYQDLNPDYKLPSKERIMEFLQTDSEFMELMRTKEKQGLTRTVLAPAPGFHSLKGFADNIGQKVISAGGKGNYYSETRRKMLANEGDIHYFSTDGSTGGATGEEVKANPEKYGICDGWMISFTTDEQNMANKDKPAIGGRVAIKTSLSARGYQEKYFSGKDPVYKGEEAMIPQEHFALFAKDLYEKYIKTKKQITTSSKDLLDSETLTWFISTYISGDASLPRAGWLPGSRELYGGGFRPADSDDFLGVRPSVRRKLNL